MNPDEYQKAALRTAKQSQTVNNKLTEGVMGLTGECGECVDIVKKCVFQGHDLNIDLLVEELGDVCWYVVILADALKIPFSKILKVNIDKLNHRYPNGFESSRSVYRNDKEWRKQFEDDGK